VATDIEPVWITRDGVTEGDGVTGDTDYTVTENDGLVVLEVVGPSDAVVTAVPSAVEMAGFTVQGNPVSVSANTVTWLGPFPPAVFGDELALTVDTDDLLIRAYRI
jgi:hypothetical protein